MKKLLLLMLATVSFSINASSQETAYVPGDIIVQMKPGYDVHKLEQSLQTWQGKTTRLEIRKELSAPLRIWLMHFDFEEIGEIALLEAMRRQSGVQEAQLNHLITLRETIPNDPLFDQQWQWVNTGQGGGTPDADVDADLAWDITTGGTTSDGREIVVCIVEGGNLNHPDLQGNLWVNQEEIPGNGIDDDGNGYVDDYKGWNTVTDTDDVAPESHGTTVGGMIGAKGNNGQYVTGINWDVKLMYVGRGSLTEANVIEAYTYPLVMRRRYNQSGGTQGAFVVATNSSWGIDNGKPENSPLWCAFYDSLGVEGILSCGSTSNSNVNVDIVGDLPTGCTSEYLVSVTASNRNDVRTFSGYGTTSVDLAAPGESIVSLSLNGGPTTTSGTSFASPLTAGVIALLYSAPCNGLGQRAILDPAGTAMLVRDALFNGVDVKPNLVGEVKTGGRVNAYNSLLLLLQSCGPCPNPFSITLQHVIDTTATLSWASTDSTLQTNLRWHLAGDTTWNLEQNITSPFTFTGLTACTQYEFQLEDICADTTSGYTDSIIFKTDGCCEPPAVLEVSSVTFTGAQVTWNSVYAANSYNLLLSFAQGEMLIENLTDTVYVLADLDSCTHYQVSIRTVCDTGWTDFSLPISFKTFGCGACTDLAYCSSASTDASEEWIANVSIGDLDNASGSDSGYGDFTGLSTDFETYKSYSLSLSPGYLAGNYNEAWGVWIDFNQDGDFSDPGEKVFTGAASNSTVTGSFSVPGTALPGLTRMRIIMRYNVQPAACNTYNFGETEDYCVNIIPGTPPDCHAPEGLSVAGISFTEAFLAWNAVGDALSYECRYRKTGTGNWTTLVVSDTAKALNNLEVCTEYEFQVRAACAGVTGDWSASFAFATDCYPPCNDVPIGLDTSSVAYTAAQLHWSKVGGALKYKLGWKNALDPNYTIVLVSDTTFTLSGLVACTVYQFRVRAVCLGEVESEPSEVFEFVTACVLGTDDLKGDLQEVSVFPNPFGNEISVSFSLRRSQELRLDLYDARGQRLYTFTGTYPGGNSQLRIGTAQTGELPAGVYFVKIADGKGYSVRKVVKE